jgi:hypothetical protein
MREENIYREYSEYIANNLFREISEYESRIYARNLEEYEFIQEMQEKESEKNKRRFEAFI